MITMLLIVLGVIAYLANVVAYARQRLRVKRMGEWADEARKVSSELRRRGFVPWSATSSPQRIEWRHPDGRYVVLSESKEDS